MNKWMLTILVVAIFSGGCQSLRPLPEAKKEAYDRWHQTRAQMLCNVAGEHLKVGQLPEAMDKARQAVALDPNLTAARTILAKVYIERGLYDEAVGELETIARTCPNTPEVHYLLGVAQEKAGRLPEALVCYNRAAALDAEHLDAVKAAAEVHVAMGNPRMAMLLVESRVRAATDDPGMFELAGRIALMNDEPAQAAKYFQQARDLDFRNVRYHENLAQAQHQAGQHEAAAETLRELMTHKDYKAPAWLYAMLGDSYLSAGQNDKARDAYWQASELDPASPGIWVKIAKAALATGDMSRAVLASQHAMQLQPDGLEAVLVLGYALLRDGQTARSIRVLTQASAAHPESGMLLCLLGRAHAQAGDEAQAMRCYAGAVKLDPQDVVARALLAGEGVRKLTKTE